eukprot:6092031-Pleurochrysis_carterae.AAC.1
MAEALPAILKNGCYGRHVSVSLPAYSYASRRVLCVWGCVAFLETWLFERFRRAECVPTVPHALL